MKKSILIILTIAFSTGIIISCFTSCQRIKEKMQNGQTPKFKTEMFDLEQKEETEQEIDQKTEPVDETTLLFVEPIAVDFTAPYATYSIINTGHATLYKQNPNFKGERKLTTSVGEVIVATPNDITITVNAGHGTKNGSLYKTYSHPDLSPITISGTNKEGTILSYAISDGTVLDNGMKESDANLLVACRLKDKLLADGYSVLMIREDNDAKLDNISRCVIANQNSDAHVSIHFDSTDSDKGIFFIVPVKDEHYLNMEPLKSNIDNVYALGKSIINAFKEMGENIRHEVGMQQGDLTQLSYSTIPSIDIEVGDKKTEISDERIDVFAEGIKRGIDDYFFKK